MPIHSSMGHFVLLHSIIIARDDLDALAFKARTRSRPHVKVNDGQLLKRRGLVKLPDARVINGLEADTEVSQPRQFGEQPACPGALSRPA
jgi:hypothetical protein